MRRVAPLAVIMLLAAGFFGLTGGRALAVTQAAQPAPSQTCILIIFCFPSGSSPSPLSSPATTSPAASSLVGGRHAVRERDIARRPPVAIGDQAEGRHRRPGARGVRRHVVDDRRLRDDDRLHL